MNMRLTLGKKICGIILAVFVLSTFTLMVIQHVLYSRNVDRTLAAIEKSVEDMKHRDGKDVLLEVKNAVEGSLQRGEYKLFTMFAEQQKQLTEIRAFSFFNKEGKTELSSDPQRVGQALGAALFEQAKKTSEAILVDSDAAFSYYQPLKIDNDMRRLHPEWKVGDVYGVLHLEFSKDGVKKMQADARSLFASGSRKVATVVVGVSLVAAALVVISALVVSRRIARPVRNAVSVLQEMSQGDFTKRVEISGNDEIADLGRALDTTSDTLRRTVEGIRDHAQTLAKSSSALTAVADTLASGAEETTAQSTTVAAAAEEMSANMSTIAGSSEQMSANVKTVAAAVEEMTASIAEVARNAEQAANIAENAAKLASTSNQNISQLGSAADEIGKVIGVIQDIAEQTNLLALNATIEAARAGDAGKGFAVVATEVKELAKQTAEATEDIRRRIEAIQSSTGGAVQSIGEITQVIHKVNEVSRTIASAVEEQSITTKEIAQNVAQTANASTTVSEGVNQSATASREISKNMTGVDTAARQTAEGAAQTQTAGQELATLADQLQALVGRFKV
ncbi:MAG TPA: methyl-accepting chemotaxis protein [Phycisphaerae bacterium]|nr:methyl-accepting chemotaxis protein [Phycisphaerae bacterium]HRY70557.1 methyl-accepting chemotaxis protein [Phycisphaerae bacterium]HSA28005.1 methyl-accepting chemotaxis protein [Phycisphaerae bacterium]